MADDKDFKIVEMVALPMLLIPHPDVLGIFKRWRLNTWTSRADSKDVV